MKVVAEFSFASVIFLAQFRRNIHWFKCDLCGYEFSWQCNTLSPIKIVHNLVRYSYKFYFSKLGAPSFSMVRAHVIFIALCKSSFLLPCNKIRVSNQILSLLPILDLISTIIFQPGEFDTNVWIDNISKFEGFSTYDASWGNRLQRYLACRK